MNVIVVEDEIIIRKMIAATLHKLGCSVVAETGNGDEAVSLVKKKKQVDLVCMDINLNGDVDGIEASKIISTFSNVSILFLSAYAKSHGDTVINEAGYLTKPINMYDFSKQIELLRERRNPA